MKSIQSALKLATAPLLGTALLAMGCAPAELSGSSEKAQLLQSWGLFAMAEMTLAALLGIGALAAVVVRLLMYVAEARPLHVWFPLFRTYITQSRTASGCLVLKVHDAARSKSWRLLRRHLLATPADAPGVIVDLSLATVVQTTFLASLCQTRSEWARARKSLEIIGLQS